MRALACLALLALALSGCSSDGASDTPAPDMGTSDEATGTASTAPATQAEPAPVALDVSGTLWLPPTQGSEMTESSVPFQLNGTADVHVALQLGSTLTPITTAQALVELRDASGKVLAQAEFSPGGMQPNEKALDASGVVAGSYELHFGTYGGSDGSGNGDYIEYRIQAD